MPTRRSRWANLGCEPKLPSPVSTVPKGQYAIEPDLHAAPTTADVLLVPPASPQLIGSLRSMFPKARVIIAEVEDDVLGVSCHGPVRRMLDAGAETYLTSTTIPSLAKQLDHTLTQRHQITGGATTRLEIEPSQARGVSDRAGAHQAGFVGQDHEMDPVGDAELGQ